MAGGFYFQHLRGRGVEEQGSRRKLEEREVGRIFKIIKGGDIDKSIVLEEDGIVVKRFIGSKLKCNRKMGGGKEGKENRAHARAERGVGLSYNTTGDTQWRDKKKLGKELQGREIRAPGCKHEKGLCSNTPTKTALDGR